MALVQTSPILYPVRGGYNGPFNNNGGSFSALALNTAGGVAHQVGRVRWADLGDHTCSKIHLVTVGVTVSSTSILRVGFQSMSGSTPRGDGNFTSYADLTQADIAAQSKILATLNSPTALTNGQLACVSAQLSTFNAGDSVSIRAALFPSAAQMPTVSLNATAQSAVPNLLLEANDGTFGIFEGGDFFSGTDDGPNWDSGATNAERGASLRVPFKCKVNGIYAAGFRVAASGGTFTLRVYTDALSTPTVSFSEAPASNTWAAATSSHRFWVYPITEMTLNPGIDYGITVEPTSLTNIYVSELNHHTAGYAAALSGGTNYKRIMRPTGLAGAFTVDDTKTLQLGFVVSALDDGTATGGRTTHPGMGGGARG